MIVSRSEHSAAQAQLKPSGNKGEGATVEGSIAARRQVRLMMDHNGHHSVEVHA